MKSRYITRLAASVSLVALGACSTFDCPGNCDDRGNPSLFPAEMVARTDPALEEGRAYQRGIGVPRDYARALRSYEIAAAAGDARAMNNLGVMALQGRGQVPNVGKASDWFRKAAAAGSAAASYNLGLLSEFGVGEPPSPAKAAASYLIAAQQGHPLAQRRLAVLLEGGRGVPADPEESRRLFEMSAMGGDREALEKISGIDRQKGAGPEAVVAFLAEEHCDCDVRERKKAAEGMVELRRLAERGDAPAQYNLGVRFLTGKGITRDAAEAARLFTRAAQQGHAPAARQLALMHLRGEAVARSRILAHAWLNLAARDRGQEGVAARAEMESLEASMSPSEVAEAQRRAASYASIGR
jgi:FOG: TPR repeat, SEL1 subfamily